MNERPLLILHGGPGLGRDYLSNGLASLRAERELISIDYLGCDDGVGGPAPSLAETLAHADREIRRATRGRVFDVLAHSWGSFALLELFRRDPRFTSGKLILVAPCPSTWSRFEQTSQNLARLCGERVPAADLARIGSLVADGNGPQDREYARLLQPAYVADAHHAASVGFTSFHRPIQMRLNQEMAGYDHSATLAGLENEIHLLIGAEDFITARELPDFIAKAKQVTALANCGHSPFIESPEPFFRSISSILTVG